MKKTDCLEMLNANFVYSRDLTGFENFTKYQIEVKKMLDYLFEHNNISEIDKNDIILCPNCRDTDIIGGGTDVYKCMGCNYSWA